jgi:hypothetical protein
MPDGTKWGEINQYLWLFSNILVPEVFTYPNGQKEHAVKGQRLVMELNPDGERA